MIRERDGEWEWKQFWASGQGEKVEDDALRRIARNTSGYSPDSWLSVVGAVRDAILGGWDAGWKAAIGENEDE